MEEWGNAFNLQFNKFLFCLRFIICIRDNIILINLWEFGNAAALYCIGLAPEARVVFKMWQKFSTLPTSCLEHFRESLWSAKPENFVLIWQKQSCSAVQYKAHADYLLINEWKILLCSKPYHQMKVFTSTQNLTKLIAEAILRQVMCLSVAKKPFLIWRWICLFTLATIYN